MLYCVLRHQVYLLPLEGLWQDRTDCQVGRNLFSLTVAQKLVLSNRHYRICLIYWSGFVFTGTANTRSCANYRTIGESAPRHWASLLTIECITMKIIITTTAVHICTRLLMREDIILKHVVVWYYIISWSSEWFTYTNRLRGGIKGRDRRRRRRWSWLGRSPTNFVASRYCTHTRCLFCQWLLRPSRLQLQELQQQQQQSMFRSEMRDIV